MRTSIRCARLTVKRALCYAPCMHHTRFCLIGNDKTPAPPPYLRPASCRAVSGFLKAMLLGSALVGLLSAESADAKRKPVQRHEPDLRIVAVTASPEPYSPGTGSLDLAVEVELPKELNGATLLEVSSLISSQSKRSLRFISSRQTVTVQPASESPLTAQTPADSSPLRIVVKLSWDGTDQTKQLVESGRYHYEVRAKLLVVGENGPRTQMVSWPRRGTLEVK